MASRDPQNLVNDAIDRELGGDDFGLGTPQRPRQQPSNLGAPAPTAPTGLYPNTPTFASGVFDPENRHPDPPPLPGDPGFEQAHEPRMPRVTPDSELSRPPQMVDNKTPSPATSRDIGTGIPRAAPQSRATNPQEAYDSFAGSVDVNAPPEEMERAIEAAFGGLPGYGGAYKESVMLNGQWYDLIGGYGGPNASFHGLMPKTGGRGAGMFGFMDAVGQNGMPSIDDESRLSMILQAIDAMARGIESPLAKDAIDRELGNVPAPQPLPQPVALQPTGAVRRYGA